MIAPSDFTFQGFYRFTDAAHGYSLCSTLRYVDGEPRLLCDCV